MKYLINALLHHFGYILIKKNNFEEKKKIFKNLVVNNSPLIFDVGSHKGETVMEMKKIFTNSKIHCFEPDPTTFKTLKHNTTKIKNIYLNNFALSNKDENETKFYRQSHSKLNSLKKINLEGNVMRNFFKFNNYSKNSYNKPILVKSTKLDTYCKKKKISKIDLLKIDVEGAELDCLIGSKEILKKTDTVYVEFHFHDKYGIQNNFLDIESLLIPKGFNLYSLVRVNNQKNNNRIGWIEAIYTKKNIL